MSTGSIINPLRTKNSDFKKFKESLLSFQKKSITKVALKYQWEQRNSEHQI